MNLLYFIIALFSLQGLCLYIGSRYASGLKNNDDYFLASRSLKFFPLMMTFVATQVGGGLVLGSAEEAYRYGWWVLFYPTGAALGLFFLSLGIGARMSTFNVGTVAQLFETVYGSTTLKKFASALSILSLYMIFIGQLIASQKFLISLGLDSQFIFIAFWLIVIVYTVMGGLKAVVATDVIQALFFLVVFALAFFFAVWVDDYSFKESISYQTSFNLDIAKVTGWLFMPMLFMLIEQDMAQRCFAARSGKIITMATFVAGIITLIICSIPVFFGVLAKVEGIEIRPGSSVMMEMIQSLSSPLLSAIVGSAILAAVVSTADSLINAVSSNIAQDFLKNVSVKTSQIITAVIAVAGIFISYFFSNIVDILIQSYELSVSCLLIPVAFAVITRKGPKFAAIGAIIGGLTGFIGLRAYPLDLPRELINLSLSSIGFLMGYLLDYRNGVQNSTSR